MTIVEALKSGKPYREVGTTPWISHEWESSDGSLNSKDFEFSVRALLADYEIKEDKPKLKAWIRGCHVRKGGDLIFLDDEPQNTVSYDFTRAPWLDEPEDASFSRLGGGPWVKGRTLDSTDGYTGPPSPETLKELQKERDE